MSTTVIYNDFRTPQFWRSRFRRSEFEIWDANLHHGDVRPFACPQELCSIAGSFQTLYSIRECECNGFRNYTPIVKGFNHNQHFYIDDSVLVQATNAELCNNQSVNRAGVPYPKSIPIITSNSGCSTDECDVVGMSYVSTYVSEHAGIQVESAPSPPSALIAVNPDDFTHQITVQNNPSTSQYDIVFIRIYKVESTYEDGTDSISPEGSEFVLVDQIPYSVGSVVFNNNNNVPIGPPLTTYEPMAFEAPANNLVGLARTTDGIVVADDHRVYISIPGQPQFSYDGVVEIEDTIKAIVAIQNTVFVFTDNKPVKIGYRHTSGILSIDKQIIERRLPLSSVRSLSVYNDKVYFSTTYSLYAWDIGGYGSDIRSSITSLITPEQWGNIRPETVRGVAYEFGYIFCADGINHAIMIEFGGDGTDTNNQTSLMPISYIRAHCFGLDEDGHIMYQQDGAVYRWDWRRKTSDRIDIYDNTASQANEQCECCDWKIVMYFDNEGKNRFSKMRVEWDERSAPKLDVSFYLHAFGKSENIVGPLEVISSRAFSIPKFCSSQTFCVEVGGCGIMHEIRLGTSNQELVSNSNNQIGNPGG